MSQSPLLPLVVACVSAFATLGCGMLRPHPKPVYPSNSSGNSSAGYEPTAEEQQPTRKTSDERSSRSRNNATQPTAAPPPPKYIPTSVEVRSDCNKTTPVFFGDGKPGFSSGRRSSISSNTITSEPRKGDGTLTIWVIDDHENGLSNVKITPDTKSVTLNSDCKSFKTQ